MKIALTTIGSRGDIQPYIALGCTLQKKGFDVSVLTHPWAKNLCDDYQLSHISIGEEIHMDSSIKQIVENSSNTLKGFRFAINFIFNSLKECHPDFLSELKNFDLIIGHGIVGKSEADILHKPYITVSIAPMGLQKEYWRTKNFIKESGVFLKDKLMDNIFGKPYYNFRKNMGAPPITSMKKLPYLALVPISRLMQKPNLNWRKTTEITGFFFADTPLTYQPSEELLSFLNHKDKPVLITFGSMHHNRIDTVNLYNIVCEAVKASDSRAILLMSNLDEKELNIPDYIFPVKNIPYSWLLDKVSLVVHHFGFGTTAEVLKAGLPSIPIPHIFDQKNRATQVYKSGYASKPLNIRKISSVKLADTICKIKSDRILKEKCLKARDEILNENGLDRAVMLIGGFIKEIEQPIPTK